MRSFVSVAFVAFAEAQNISDITVTSSAGFVPGIPERGALASLFCRGIQVNGTVAANGFPIAAQLAGAQVMIAGIPAPILALAELGGFQQINVQIPFEANLEADSVDVIVTQQGRLSRAMAPVRRGGPGEIFSSPNGTAAIQHASDYSLVSSTSPARPGETLIAYVTGAPVSQPSPGTGMPSPYSPLSTVPQSLDFRNLDQLYLDFLDAGNPAQTIFVGLSPGLIGVTQLNFVIPTTGVRDGPQRIQLVRSQCRAQSFTGCLLTLTIRRSATLVIPVATR